jgi:glycosyltransferase involved in cell wall biosynthesis
VRVTTRPIRIVFVVPLLQTGGSERHVTTLLPRLDPTRFVPSVVCIGDEGDLFGELVATGIQAKALHLRKWQAVRALRELIAFLRSERADVVVVTGRNAEVLGRIAAHLTGVPHTIMWVHNASEITRRSAVYRAVDRALIRWTSSYFGVAEVQRRFLVHERGYPDNKIRIIYNGVDAALFDGEAGATTPAGFGIDPGDPVVGILGSLRPEKDHATFLRAARLVIDEMPHVRFMVVGDGACRARLEALCSELGITPNVHFVGARDDVGRMLCAMDVFAMTSVTECLPMALLEAMACARPAVCTAVGGVVEVVVDGETGYLVPPEDPPRLAAGLMMLLSDPQTARRMGAAGRHRVEAEFSLDRSVEAAQDAIEDLVGAHHTLSGR